MAASILRALFSESTDCTTERFDKICQTTEFRCSCSLASSLGRHLLISHGIKYAKGLVDFRWHQVCNRAPFGSPIGPTIHPPVVPLSGPLSASLSGLLSAPLSSPVADPRVGVLRSICFNKGSELSSAPRPLMEIPWKQQSKHPESCHIGNPQIRFLGA